MGELNLFCKSRTNDLTGKLLENETILCIGGSRTDIFLGTDQGRLLRFNLIKNKYKIVESRQLPTKKVITTIELASALNSLFIVCGFEFFIVALDDFKITPAFTEVSRFALNVNPTTDDPFAVSTAFAQTKKGISVVEVTDRGTRKKFFYDTGMPVRSLAYSKDTICYALEHHYLALNTVTRQPIRLFQHDCPTPCIAPVGPDEYLVRSSSGLSIFVNGDGTSSKPPCVLSTVKGPLFFKEPHIIHCDRTKLAIQDGFTQHTEEFPFEKIDAVNYIEGQIVVVNNGTELLTIREIPTEETISFLMERKQYSQAMDLLQKSMTGNNDEDLMQLLAKCSEMSAVEEIKSMNFDAAATNLLACSMNCREIIEKLDKHKEEIGDYFLPFLKQFFLFIREDPNFYYQKQFIDYELLCTCYQLNCVEELDGLQNFTPDPIQAAQLYLKNNEVRRAADLLFEAEKYEEALPLYIKIGVILDASHLRPLLFKVEKNPDNPNYLPFFSLLAPFFPTEIMQMLRHLNLPLADVQYVLRGLPIWEEYLEKQPQCDAVVLELAIEYISSIQAGDPSKRTKLRQILLYANEQMLPKIVAFLDSELFEIELLLSRAQDNPSTTLNDLLTNTKDNDAAELLSARFAKSHPDVALRLLKSYLDDKTYSSSVNRIGRLLAHVGNNFDPEDLLSKMPDDMTIHELSSFLKTSVINKTEANSVAQLSLAAAKKVSEIEKKAKVKHNPYVELNDHSQCPVCYHPLNYGEPLTMLPTRFIVHSKCYKHPHLCPVTNTIF